MLILAVCGFFFCSRAWGSTVTNIPSPLNEKNKFSHQPKNKKQTKKTKKQNKTGQIHSLMLKMSYNEFPTRVIPAHDADAPGQYCGWI